MTQPARFLGSMDRPVDQINLQKQPTVVPLAPNALPVAGEQPVKRKRGRPPKRKKEDDASALDAASSLGSPNVYTNAIASSNTLLSPAGETYEHYGSGTLSPLTSPTKSAHYNTKSSQSKSHFGIEASPLSPTASQNQSSPPSSTSKTPVVKRSRKPASTTQRRVSRVCFDNFDHVSDPPSRLESFLRVVFCREKLEGREVRLNFHLVFISRRLSIRSNSLPAIEALFSVSFDETFSNSCLRACARPVLLNCLQPNCVFLFRGN